MDTPVSNEQLEEWSHGIATAKEESHNFADICEELLELRNAMVNISPAPIINPVTRAERMHIAVSVLPALAAQGAPPNTAAAQAIEYATALITALNP